MWRKKKISEGSPRYKPKFTIGSRRRAVSFPFAAHPRPVAAILERSYILRFNLSIVPGITEFRRKNNAYCGTHKAVGHKTHRCRARQTARKRARPAFLCPRSDPRVCMCVYGVCARADFFFLSNIASESGPTMPDVRHCAVLPASVATCDRQYRDGRLQTTRKPSWQIKIPLVQNTILYFFFTNLPRHLFRIATLIYSD